METNEKFDLKQILDTKEAYYKIGYYGEEKDLAWKKWAKISKQQGKLATTVGEVKEACKNAP